MKNIITVAVVALMLASCAKEQTAADRAIAYIDSVSTQIKAAQAPEDLGRIMVETEFEERIMAFASEIEAMAKDGAGKDEYNAEHKALTEAIADFQELFSNRFMELYGIRHDDLTDNVTDED